MTIDEGDKRVLVTGATGFLGGHLLTHLARHGMRVTALVRPQTLAQASRGRERVEVREVLDRAADVVPGVMQDARAVRQAVAGVDVVYHLAWGLAPLAPSDHRHNPGLDPQKLTDVNLSSLRCLLREAVSAGVRRFVFMSTVAVYGWSPPYAIWPITEDAVLRPRGHYAMGKAAAERIVASHDGRNGMTTVILRPTVVYGAGAERFERFAREA